MGEEMNQGNWEIMKALEAERDALKLQIDGLKKSIEILQRNYGEACEQRAESNRLNSEMTSALGYAKDAIASAWAALGDNMESQALGGKGIERPYAHQVQSQLRGAGERVSVVLRKIEKSKCMVCPDDCMKWNGCSHECHKTNKRICEVCGGKSPEICSACMGTGTQ